MKDRSALPFPGASRRFYAGENKKAKTNAKRAKQREQLPVTCISENKKLMGMHRTRTMKPLEANLCSAKVAKERLSCKQ